MGNHRMDTSERIAESSTLADGFFCQVIQDTYHAGENDSRRSVNSNGSNGLYSTMQVGNLVVVPNNEVFSLCVAEVTGEAYFGETEINEDSAYG